LPLFPIPLLSELLLLLTTGLIRLLWHSILGMHSVIFIYI
jgi:hypothetical protein